MNTEPIIPYSDQAWVAVPSAPCRRSFAQETLARLSAAPLPFGRRRPRQVRSCRTLLTNVLFLQASLLLLLPLQANATHRLATLAETVKLSDTIVHGKIVAASAQWVEDARGRHIYTYATVECLGYWKGGGGQSIVVEWPGGTVGQIMEQVSESQPLTVGEEVILFLNKNLRPAVGIYSKSPVVHGKAYGESGVTEVNQFLAAVADAAGTPKRGLIQPAVDTVRQNEPVRELTTSPAQKGNPPQPAEQKPVILRSEPPLNDPPPLAWTTIKSEDFEGAWPNGWTCTYNYTSGGVGITWATETARFHAGSKGGWPHASVWDPNYFYLGTANPSPAPPIMSSMVYGPFSLVGATDARMTFWLNYDLGAGDKIVWQASTDGLNWYGYQTGNGNNGSFQQVTFDLKTVPTIGNLCSQAAVYIRFYCEADDVHTSNRGPFLDDLVIEKYGGDPPPPAPVITSLSPSTASAGTATAVTITGSNFGATQGSSTANFYYRSGQPTIPATVTSWSDTSITCIVPVGTVSGYPGSAGSGPVTVTTAGATSAGYPFIVPFGYGQYKWPGTFPIMTYVVNENCADCTGEGAAFQSAGTTWNNAGAKFAFSYGGATTATTKSGNSINEVMWGTTLGSSTIAEATMWFNTSTMTLLECDIMFNDLNFFWDTSGAPSGSQMDVQTIAVHELGHWLSLRDLYGSIGDWVNDNGKIMYGFGGNGLLKRNLATGDLDGIRWIYGLATQAPVLANIESGALSYTENQAATPITSTLTVSDADSANLVSGTASITSGFASGQDVLSMSASPPASITTNYNASTGVLTLSGSSSVANYQAALRSMTYVNTSDNPSVTTRTVSFKLNDGTADSNPQARGITVTAVNDAPVANSVSDTTNEDTAKTITLSGSDAETCELTFSIFSYPSHGSLGEPNNNFTCVSGNPNRDTNSIVYTPAANYNGPDNFTYKVNDGTVDSPPATVTITVSSVNDYPVAFSQSLTNAEDTALAITLTGSDVDGPVTNFTVLTQPASGTLTGTAPPPDSHAGD